MGHSLNEQFAKEYNSADILKFVLSVFVMIIHSGIDKTVISPLLRMAVPLFFIASSYFFFSKNKKLTEKAEKRGALVRFIKRNVLLHLFWAVLQLPVIMFMRGYFYDLFPNGILSIVKDMVLGNGFTGSWYIIASLIGVVAVYWISKVISAGWLVLITLPLYIVCCLVTNYWNIFDSSSIVVTLGNGYHELTGLYFYTSFPVALFWVSLGRFLVEVKIELKDRTLWSICVISGALLALEQHLIVRYGLATTDDCYFMLILLCPALFLLVSRCKVTFKTNFRLREISVIVYVMHGCCERVVGYILKMLPFDYPGQNVAKIVISLVVILMLGHILIYVREKRGISFLKYAF